MRAVKSRDTAPELAVRALLRPIAPGYRLHRADLPGKPDIVYAGASSPFSFTAASGTGMTARAGRAHAQDQRRLLAAPRSPATGRATSRPWRPMPRWAGARSSIYECELKDKAALAPRLAEALQAN